MGGMNQQIDHPSREQFPIFPFQPDDVCGYLGDDLPMEFSNPYSYAIRWLARKLPIPELRREFPSLFRSRLGKYNARKLDQRLAVGKIRPAYPNLRLRMA